MRGPGAKQMTGPGYTFPMPGSEMGSMILTRPLLSDTGGVLAWPSRDFG